MIDPQMLSLLRCLQTHSPLRCADSSLRDRVNRAIAAGRVYNPFGRRLLQTLDEALVNAEGTVLYPVRQGIPQLLVDEMILLAQLDSLGQEENDG